MKPTKTTQQSPYGTGSIRSTFSFLILLVLAIGCTEADVVDGDSPTPAGQEVNASFNLQVLASQPTETRSITFKSDGTIEPDSLTVGDTVGDAAGVNDSIQTKANAPLGTESKINTLWVGQYEDGALISQSYPTLSDDTGGYTAYVKLKVNTQGKTSHIYFIANAGNPGENPAAIDTEAKIKAYTLPYNSTAEGLPDNNHFMMMAMKEITVPSSGLGEQSVALTRLVAKISLSYAIGGTGFSFTLDSIFLRNAPTLSRVEAPTTQLADISYRDYTTKNPPSGSNTFVWYLPENMAGTSSQTVSSYKSKTGKGVTNATCIELAGHATQGGIDFPKVLIRFYPGNDENNYDVIRNSHYGMNVTLVGLDLTDERITVGEVAPVEAGTDQLPAEKGGTQAAPVQIAARPGQGWVFELPEWLSALVNGTPATAGSTITYQGPAGITLTAATANPKAEPREATINLTMNNETYPFTVTQAGSKLTLNNNISLDVSGEVESPATFTATKGLKWEAVPSAGWILFTADSPTKGDATGGPQTLKVKADGVNQYAESREGRIILKAGASITDDTYAGLRDTIAVVQMGSKVFDCSVLNNVAAEGVLNQSGSFTATPGLDWRLITGGNDNWLHIKSATSGSPATVSPQTVSFDVDVNPNSTLRNGGITVQAGDQNFGPKGKIVVSQLGSTFELVSPSTVVLGSESQEFIATIKGTKGLKWEVNPHTAPNQIAPIAFNGDVTGEEQPIAFAARENFFGSRTEIFDITVPGGDHKKTITVKQKGNPILTINQDVLTKYVAQAGDLTEYPPFDIDGDGGQGIKDKHKNVIFTLDGANPTITGYYQLQVQSTQPGNYAYQSGSSFPAREYCEKLREGGFSDWRLPTLIELYIMWDKAKGTNNDASDYEPDSNIYGEKLRAVWYWSSSIYGSDSSARYVQDFSSGNIGASANNLASTGGWVRCVRDLN